MISAQNAEVISPTSVKNVIRSYPIIRINFVLDALLKYRIKRTEL